MKTIGIIHGAENSFPDAVIERINKLGLASINADHVLIDMVEQSAPTEYAVIIDRLSHIVPFYRAYLRNAAVSGTAVLNNPFWWSADEKFFNNALALKLGVLVPNTVLLPSRDRPHGTDVTTFTNLKFPLNWEKIFDYIRWPAYLKPYNGGAWQNVYRVGDPAEFFKAYSETGQQVMMLQEEILFDDYFRCLCLGGKYVRIMRYEPRNPHHLRYEHLKGPIEKKLMNEMEKTTIALCAALGYDINSVEIAVRDGAAYAIDFCNPVPDANVTAVGQDNFEWAVEHLAKLAVDKAHAQDPKQNNLTWGTFVSDAARGK